VLELRKNKSLIDIDIMVKFETGALPFGFLLSLLEPRIVLLAQQVQPCDIACAVSVERATHAARNQRGRLAELSQAPSFRRFQLTERSISLTRPAEPDQYPEPDSG